MSVKSTVELSRDQAIERYADLRMQELQPENMHEILKSQAELHSDKFIEDEMERIDDNLHDGESFRNYSIVSQNSGSTSK